MRPIEKKLKILPSKNSSRNEPIRGELKILAQDIRAEEIPQIRPTVAVMTGIHHGTNHSKNDHMQKVACRVMAELKAKQTSFAINTEIKPEMSVQLVMEFGALANSRDPIFQKLHIRIWPFPKTFCGLD